MKDYVAVAGSLDISHIMTVSQTKSNNVVLKIARHPSGPTLHFRVHKYSLSGQVKAIQKKPYDSTRACKFCVNKYSQLLIQSQTKLHLLSFLITLDNPMKIASI